MSKRYSKYSPKQKIQMVMEALTHSEGIQAYCRAKGIKDNQIYLWKNKIVENAENLLTTISKREENRIMRLQGILQEKNDVIAELAHENLELKKRMAA